MLSLLVFLPVLGMLAVLLVPKEQAPTIRSVATVAAALPLVLVALLWGSFDIGREGFQFVQRLDWVPSLGMSYYLGVDGIGFIMVALTALVFFLAVVASYGITERVKEYFALILLLETAVFGVFTALDYVLFYVFWELVLIPMYFLIAIWGGPRREYAAIKFLIYTMVGSLLMLVGIVALYFGTGAHTFSIPDIAAMAPGMIGMDLQRWIFLAFFAGFAVKVPVFPFHTWLPDAHVEAPTPISVVLAAILLKMGLYGFLRISHPTLPEAAQAFAWLFAVLGIVNMIYGGLAALAQRDLKKLVAYSSINHMGFVMLGIGAAAAAPELRMAAVALNGAIFQMVSHGLISAMLFLMVGVFYDRTHTREMAKMSGLYITMPVAATIMAFAAMGNLGLPGLSGFIAEFFTLLGTLHVFTNLVYWALVGLVITAAFNIVMMYRILMGPPMEEYAGLSDISRRETVTLVPLMAASLLLGLVPSVAIRFLNGPVLEFVAKIGGGM